MISVPSGEIRGLDTVSMSKNCSSRSFLTGWDAVLMPMLLVGCDGGTNATSGIVPEVTRKLYDLTLARRIDEARDLQFQLVDLFDAMIFSIDFPEGVRAALKLRGFEPGPGRQPLSPDQRVDLAGISDRLQCLLAQHGYTDEPRGGCPSQPRGSVDTREVGRIVESVVAELKRQRAI